MIKHHIQISTLHLKTKFGVGSFPLDELNPDFLVLAFRCEFNNKIHKYL